MGSEVSEKKLPVPTSANSELAAIVRNWVHFDNLAENLNKQVTNARSLRSEYETKVLHMLETSNMKNSTIKISGATLQYATRTKQTDLGWTMLSDHLHDYFRTKGRADETNEILNYLQKVREVKSVPYLKKITTS